MVKAIAKTAKLIRGLNELDGARVSELASHLGMPESTIHAHLSTLREEELVVKRGDEYRNGLEFTRIGRSERFSNTEYRLAHKYVRQISEEIGHRSAFMTEQHGMAVFVHSYTGSDTTLNYEKVGERDHMTVLAGGKAILAELPAQRRTEIIDERGMPQKTPNSITTRERLDSELETTRERGFALNDEESVEGMRALSVAVSHESGHPIGAFSIAGPAKSLRGEWFTETLPDTLMGLANQFELEISHGESDA
jgi:DNA-binding IclR family transcriptional regulator